MTTTNKECFGEVFNIGAGGQTTILDLVNVIKKELKSDVEIIFGNKREGDIPHSNACIDKAKSVLGYNPSVTFENGIYKLLPK